MNTANTATTLEALKTYLNIPPDNEEKDTLLMLLLESCTEAAERYLGRNILARDIEGEPHDFEGSKSKYLQLEHYPVLEIKQIMQNGAAVPPCEVKTDMRNGIIKNARARWRGVVTVDYKAGLAESSQSVPKNIQLALWQWAAEILREQEACGIKSETLGDYSVSYGEESPLPAACAMLLEPYRKVSL